LDFLRSLVLIMMLISIPLNSYADWYILLPKRKPEKKVQPGQKMPKIPLKKVKPKPYKVEIRRILAPNFVLHTWSGKKVSKSQLEGKPTVLVFVDDLFSPLSEKLASFLDKLASEGKVNAVLVDVKDSDFVLIPNFKRVLGAKKVIITADSYLFKVFKERLKKLSIPSIVVIDRFGFIRFFAEKVNSKSGNALEKELAEVLNSLKKKT